MGYWLDDELRTTRRIVTRRGLLHSAAALATSASLASLLAACGGGSDASEDSAPTRSPSGDTTSTEPTATQESEHEPSPTAGSTATEETATSEATSSSAGDGAWSFTDDRGITITLPKRPERIVAQTTAGAALWDYGVRPVGIFGPTRRQDGSVDFQAGNIDLDAVEHLGNYGELDLEKLVSLQPDLCVGMALYDGQLWYLSDNEDSVKEIVPTLGISMQHVSIVESIDRFEELAGMLGADLTAQEVVDAKETFARAEEELHAAIEEKPGLTVLVTSPAAEQVYIASYEWMTSLRYFHDLGLDIVDHGTDDFFELLSWEQVNKYPADLILVDARSSALTPDELMEIETWAALPAVQAGQVGPWYAGAPYSHERFAPIMQELAGILHESRTDLV